MNKRLFLTLLCLLMVQTFSWAVPVKNMPIVRVQPNGDTIRFFLSGDEYYHRYHDADGYTILQNSRTGYWVYADTMGKANGGWTLVPTQWIVGQTNTSLMGIAPNLKIDREDWQKRLHRFDIPKDEQHHVRKDGQTNRGLMNNLVIFIRFSDDDPIPTTFSTINSMFNDSSANATSMYAYFRNASYHQLSIVTHYYPEPSNEQVNSYQDNHPRSYYMPYDSVSNTNGYVDENDRADREFTLLQHAVQYVQNNCNIPSTINFDCDNDGYVDNVCFVVKGTYTGWSDLLWPHKWAIHDRYVTLNGKRVYTFNLQLEGSGTHYFSSSTFCHEMFHTLGAPDLYHYYDNTEVSSVGSWDLMEQNTTPPQHTNVYMKYRYGNWVDSIPEIMMPGTYTLHSLGDSSNYNNAYCIATSDPNQWYILEYRDNTEPFETTIPGKGLLIYRVDTRFSGNANYDGTSVFDEVYLFRPGGINSTTNGNLYQAFFSGNTSRTTFSPSTNPFPYLTHDILDTTFSITNIGVPGETITFTFNDLRGCLVPYELSVSNVGAHTANLHWRGNATAYRVQLLEEETEIMDTVVHAMSLALENLSLGTSFQWRVKAVCSETDSSSWSAYQSFETYECELQQVIIATEEIYSPEVPINNFYNYSYTQQIYTHDEMGNAPKSIQTASFYYIDQVPNRMKYNCRIYLGHTTKDKFSGSSASHFVPFSDLQLVYSGPFYFDEGWNEIRFQNAFQYNGNDNLVLAIDDLSGDYQAAYFSCNATDDYTTLSYYSDDFHFDPQLDHSYSGTKQRNCFRSDVIFGTCVNPNFFTISVQANDEELGSVAGSGNYFAGDTVAFVATPSPHCHFNYWTSDNGDTISANPYLFVAENASQWVGHFSRDLHLLSLQSSNPSMGTAWISNDESCTSMQVPYGNDISIHARPKNGCFFNGWSDGSQESNRFYTVSDDVTLIAFFSDHVGIGDCETSSFVVRSNNGSLVVEGTQGEKVWLYDLQGRMLQFQEGKEPVTFKVPAAGVYLLKVGGQQVRKIVVL